MKAILSGVEPSDGRLSSPWVGPKHERMRSSSRLVTTLGKRMPSSVRYEGSIRAKPVEITTASASIENSSGCIPRSMQSVGHTFTHSPQRVQLEPSITQVEGIAMG